MIIYTSEILIRFSIERTSASQIHNPNNNDNDQSNDDRGQEHLSGINITVLIQGPGGLEGEDNQPGDNRYDNKPQYSPPERGVTIPVMIVMIKKKPYSFITELERARKLV